MLPQHLWQCVSLSYFADTSWLMALPSVSSCQLFIALTVYQSLPVWSAHSNHGYESDHDSAPPSGLRPLDTLVMVISDCWHVISTATMARNYLVKAIQKYPITATPPLEDNYTNGATYQWDLKEFQRHCDAIVAWQWAWIAHQEAEYQHCQAKADRATEELRAWKAEEVAAMKQHAEVAKGKWPEVMIPSCGEGSSMGQRWVMEVIGKEQGELFPEWVGMMCLVCTER